MNLFYLPPSPPCRAVLLLIRVLGIDVNLKTMNILEGDHLRKDFLEVKMSEFIKLFFIDSKFYNL